MTGKGEYYVRCKNCGRLIKIFHTPTQVYCTNCAALFDYDTQDAVFSGITTVPSDYHYEWKKEKNIEDELTKYKRAFEILKEKKIIEVLKFGWGNQIMIRSDHLTKEEYELLEELMNNASNNN